MSASSRFFHREYAVQIALPREIKIHEYRVALTPAGVRELVLAGHAVTVETGAGRGAGFEDDAYRAAGAAIAPDAAATWSGAALIVKVKEPQPPEIARLRPGQLLFTYLHLAADRAQTEGLLASGATAIAYETVRAADGSLPLLAPMSEVAGRLSIQVAAACQQKSAGGAGVLLGGVPGVLPGRVLVLGGGVAGSNAARMAVGLGADVTIVDRSLPRLRELAREFDGRVKTAYSTQEAVERLVADSDVVIGSALVPGAAAPKLVTRAMLATMRPGSVLVDIAIDQGGCFETSRATTHADPSYVVEGIVHYCVANMPGAVPRTSTQALTQATLPYVKALAGRGVDAVAAADPGFALGVNVHAGALCCEPVARALGMPFTPVSW
jgi:alanine dehydrogenase